MMKMYEENGLWFVANAQTNEVLYACNTEEEAFLWHQKGADLYVRSLGYRINGYCPLLYDRCCCFLLAIVGRSIQAIIIKTKIK